MAPPPDELRAKLSRRRLLKSSLIGTAAVALAGAGLALQKTESIAAPAGGLSVLAPEEYAVLVALADRLCPGGKTGFPKASELDVAGSVDALFRYAPAEEKDGIKMALRLFESALTGALFGERAVPFTKLDAASQDRVLRAWRDSSVAFRRTVYVALSGLIQSVYWGDPRTWTNVGYPGPLDAAGLRKTYAEQLVDWNGLRALPQIKEG